VGRRFNKVKRGLYRLINLKLLLLAISYTVVLAASVPVEVEPSFFDDAQVRGEQLQETAVTLSLDELRQPHFLKINALNSKTQLTGQIEIDGKFFQRFDRDLKINLSPYLTSGKHTIHISGRYHPIDDSIQIELIGAKSHVTQETGGNGNLNQILIIDVVS
jgi:hypothetical protein